MNGKRDVVLHDLEVGHRAVIPIKTDDKKVRRGTEGDNDLIGSVLLVIEDAVIDFVGVHPGDGVENDHRVHFGSGFEDDFTRSQVIRGRIRIGLAQDRASHDGSAMAVSDTGEAGTGCFSWAKGLGLDVSMAASTRATFLWACRRAFMSMWSWAKYAGLKYADVARLALGVKDAHDGDGGGQRGHDVVHRVECGGRCRLAPSGAIRCGLSCCGLTRTHRGRSGLGAKIWGAGDWTTISGCF